MKPAAPAVTVEDVLAALADLGAGADRTAEGGGPDLSPLAAGYREVVRAMDALGVRVLRGTVVAETFWAREGGTEG